MSRVVRSGKSLILALMLGAFGAAGGVLATSMAFPASVVAGEVHPCQDQECESDCPIWNPGCDERSCEEAVEDSGTYCDTSEPGEGDCDTRACEHDD